MSYGKDDIGWQDCQVSEAAMLEAENEIKIIRDAIELIAHFSVVVINDLNAMMRNNNVDLPSDFTRCFSEDFEVIYCEDAIEKAQAVIDDYNASKE